MIDVDRRAVKKMLSVVPAWRRVVTASEAFGLSDRTLLHCGPPAEPSHNLITPILNSAAVACVFEGWASTLSDADRLIADGEIQFEPAQDWSVVTPMAAVVSPSMRLTEFVDLNVPEHRAWAPLNGGGTGADPVPRYGYKSEAALEFLQFLNNTVAEDISTVPVDDPIQWLPIIDEALTRGDDGHLRHIEAHKLLVTIIHDRLDAEFAGSETSAFIGKWPFFHLNFWMAASKLILSSAIGTDHSTIITAFGGNGDEFGLQVAGLPGKWFTCPASAPLGNIREPHTVHTCVGAFGDSAVAEGLGLGAMAQSYCPDMQALHAGFTPDDIFELPEKILLATHPGMTKSRARVGLSAQAVVEENSTPIVELGIADKYGVNGGLGAGIYRPPIAPFAAACDAVV
ncbi:MAG: hypothetical protein CMM52_14610 [Rhodospirillaceae bacterium]|nr:hypothetical protein [Rhodospirillaceae bacterium]|tara:strand:+ start:735 stop:1931 length:1197 start_codon:yes stop_codon:yes gene_type:complete